MEYNPLHKSLRLLASLTLIMMTEPILVAQEIPQRPDLIPRLYESYAKSLATQRSAPPTDPDLWPDFQQRLRERHAAALGVALRHEPSPIIYEALATLPRDGYILKKIVFESDPGVVIPAHLYVPTAMKQPAPAVLCVHGHWPAAKNAPEVHARCVFLAQRGFVVLALDAIGSGERAYDGISYHGRQLGYQALPTGMTLAGLQILDNRRAIDLLAAMPEVDPAKIGVTGASGGGNQTFHLTILDTRVKAAVAVCFFGAYEGYLRGAHCACETVPGVLTYAEEGLAASLIAPRPFMIIAAKEDMGAAFRIEDARKNAEVTAAVYGPEGEFLLAEFEGGHAYSRLMRERMVAFFEKHLMNREVVEPVSEPELALLSPEELRVFEDENQLKETSYVPQIVANRAAQLIEWFESSPRRWSQPKTRRRRQKRLIADVFGGFPTESSVSLESAEPARVSHRLGTFERKVLRTEVGVELDLRILARAKPNAERTVVIVVLGAVPDDFELPGNGDGYTLCSVFPRGTGPSAWPAANAVNCEDYLLAQGSNVLGRPIVGQWVWDALQVQSYFRSQDPEIKTAFFGEGIMGLVAILAGALSDDSAAVGAADVLASYEWPDRFDDRWGLAHFVPGILRFGDIAHIAAAIPPRPLAIGAPRDGGGNFLTGEALRTFAARIGSGDGSPGAEGTVIGPEMSPAETLAKLIDLTVR